MIRVCGIAFAAAFTYLILGEFNRQSAKIIISVAFVIIFAAFLASLSDSYSQISDLLSETELSEYASLLFRAVGIIFASEATSETCKTLGADSCAVGIDFACRAELLILLLPSLGKLFSLATSLL